MMEFWGWRSLRVVDYGMSALIDLLHDVIYFVWRKVRATASYLWIIQGPGFLVEWKRKGAATERVYWAAERELAAIF